ncbi:MAG: methyltransferase domain-containing protein [Chloroflexi bacterium]|nr:methyltransferase domain-containing protein [Chloroflexota bacterium]
MGETLDEEKEYYSLTIRAWRAWAPFYDLVTKPFLSRLRSQVVDFVNPMEGSRILDIATGTGEQAFAFARRGYDVVGIDLSEDLLRVAKKKNRFTNARFEIADATDLPFEDASFDLTCISFALHDMPLSIRQKVLKEMVRVTKPKGTILIVDYGLPRSKIGQFLVYHIAKLYEGPYYSGFIKSDLVALLRKAGIEIARETSVVLGVGRILKGTKIQSSA